MAIDKKARLRRARQTRLKIASCGWRRLAVYRSNPHIYANIICAGRRQGAGVGLDAGSRSAQQLAGKTGAGGNVAAAAWSASAWPKRH